MAEVDIKGMLKAMYPYLESAVGPELAGAGKTAVKNYSNYGLGAALRGGPSADDAAEAYQRQGARPQTEKARADLLPGAKVYGQPDPGVPDNPLMPERGMRVFGPGGTTEVAKSMPKKPPKDMRRWEAVESSMGPGQRERLEAEYGLTEEEADVMLHGFADSAEGRDLAGKIKTGEVDQLDGIGFYNAFLAKQIGGE